MHFCAALLVSVILAAPWMRLLGPSILIAIAGCYGAVYVARVGLRMMRMRSTYLPRFDDWFWYTVVPLAAYLAILAAAILLQSRPRPALFILAAGTALLIFVGIRNAWDTVTFIAVEGTPPPSP